MKPLTKQEMRITAVIVLVLFVVIGVNLNISIRRSRDAQRKADVSVIANAMNSFYADFGYFPPSVDGKILACRGENFDEIVAQMTQENFFDRQEYFKVLRICQWGEDSLTDLLDEGFTPYLKKLPIDPRHDKGISYLYLSDTKYYQILSYLEGGPGEDVYRSDIVARALKCGNEICSYGRGFSDIPLHISIEEYEATLVPKSQ